MNIKAYFSHHFTPTNGNNNTQSGAFINILSENKIRFDTDVPGCRKHVPRQRHAMGGFKVFHVFFCLQQMFAKLSQKSQPGRTTYQK